MFKPSNLYTIEYSSKKVNSNKDYSFENNHVLYIGINNNTYLLDAFLTDKFGAISEN